MGPNGTGALVLVVLLAVAAAGAVGWGWSRVRRWWAWPARVAALALSVLLAAAAAAVAVNRELNVYTSWGQLFGGSDGGPVAGRATVSRGAAGSQVVRFTVPGKDSGISLTAYAYLPPGYDSPAGQALRYPVIEAVDGFPGSPNTWLISLKAATYLDREISAGRMAPTIVVFPYQYTDPAHDGECVDAAGGQRWDTFLSLDVRHAVTAEFRARNDRAGWAIIGTSTGGFCAANLALRHPDRYASAASLSGYFTAITDRTTGDLYRGDVALREQNSPLWRIQHLPVPDLPLYLAAARDDRGAYQQIEAFSAAAREPLRLTVTLVPQGGHTGGVWLVLEPAAYDWLSATLAAPVPADPAAGPAGPG